MTTGIVPGHVGLRPSRNARWRARPTQSAATSEAHVVLREGFTADESCIKLLQDRVKATIAPYKSPACAQGRLHLGACDVVARGDDHVGARGEVEYAVRIAHEVVAS
jgi:hypothetical protein